MDTHVGLNVATRVCDVYPDKCWFDVLCRLWVQSSRTLRRSCFDSSHPLVPPNPKLHLSLFPNKNSTCISCQLQTNSQHILHDLTVLTVMGELWRNSHSSQRNVWCTPSNLGYNERIWRNIHYTPYDNNGSCTAMWKVNGKTTALVLFQDKPSQIESRTTNILHEIKKKRVGWLHWPHLA